MTSTETTGTQQAAGTTQVHRVYIKATPERIWQAITDPEWNGRYGYGAPGEFELRPGGTYRSLATDGMRASAAQMGWELPDVIVDGEVLEVDPPRRLVQSFQAHWDADMEQAEPSRVTWEIEPNGEASRLRVTHEGLTAAAARQVSGGWPQILSGLKTLLETGEPLALQPAG